MEAWGGSMGGDPAPAPEVSEIGRVVVAPTLAWKHERDRGSRAAAVASLKHQQQWLPETRVRSPSGKEHRWPSQHSGPSSV